jgi:hypothetical protein
LTKLVQRLMCLALIGGCLDVSLGSRHAGSNYVAFAWFWLVTLLAVGGVFAVQSTKGIAVSSAMGFVSRVSQNSVSVGWQAALGGAIAADVLHDPNLGFVVAAGLGAAWHVLSGQAFAKTVEADIAKVKKDIAPAPAPAAPTPPPAT